MRYGWSRPVHCKSLAAQEVRALLTARKLVQSKLLDMEMSVRGIVRADRSLRHKAAGAMTSFAILII
jgi:hypothetical protein